MINRIVLVESALKTPNNEETQEQTRIIRKVIRYNIIVGKSVKIMKVTYFHLTAKEQNNHSMLESLKEKVYRIFPQEKDLQ